jgi:outer membrane protein assembly factor BamB
MYRSLGLLVALQVWMLVGPVVGGAQEHKTAPESPPFSFLEITDTLQSAQGDTEPLHRWAESVAAMSPRPAFVVHTGNLTQYGRPEEYSRLKAALAPLDTAGIKFYAVPGNRDVRWSPSGKEGFVNEFGKTYQSFDVNGAHFVLLDSTVLLEHWGHFDKAELDWLARDLKRVKPGSPIFLFMHHWIGRDLPSARMIDNEFDLVPLLRGHNVIAIFNGHGLKDLAWQTNGVETLMARGFYQGSYYRVSVTGSLVSIDRFTREKPGQATLVASVPVANKARASVMKAGWDDPDVPYLNRKRPSATLDPRAVLDNPDKETAQYRIDDGALKPLTKNARDIWQDVFPTAPLAIGIHTVDVRLTTSNSVTYSDELIFEVERDSREPTRKWAINLDGPIQSSPVLAQDTLYVSSVDGHVYALNIQNGKRRWTFSGHGPFVATPVLSGGTLYVGSTDHFLYALAADTGRQLWRFDTGSPVFASVAVLGGTVCLGSSGRIYGLDASSGTPRWTQSAGGFFQSRAVASSDTFYLGGWDNTLYALDAAAGTPRWTVHLGNTLDYSPAIASPALGNGRVYICSNDGVLHALNVTSGHEEWSTFVPAGGDPFGYSSPSVIGTTLYLAGLGERGDVYALDTASGKEQWRSPIGQPIYDSSVRLAPDGRSLAIMGVRGHVAVLAADTGKPIWSYELGPGNIFSTPEYDGSIVYTTTMDNDVQALNAPGAK